MKRLFFLLLLILCCTTTSFAAEDDHPLHYQAHRLYEIGLFSGTGTDQYGRPVYELNRAPTREEAVTMLVRMLGASEIAAKGSWNLPFSDFSAWARPFIGYAYSQGLTSGTSATTFSGSDPVTATQFITMMLQALGYQSGVDFEWDKAWMLTDKLGITNHPVIDSYNGQLNTIDSVADYKNGGTGPNGLFTRGDAAALMFALLNQQVTLKNSDMTINRSILNTMTKDLPTEISTYEGLPAFYVANTSANSVTDCLLSGVELGYDKFYVFAPNYGIMEDIGYSWYDPVEAFVGDYNLSLKSTYFDKVTFSSGGGLIGFGPSDKASFIVHVGTRSSDPRAPWNSDQSSPEQNTPTLYQYDQWGRPVYIDDLDFPYYLDDQGLPIYPDSYDQYGRAIFIDESGQPYYIDTPTSTTPYENTGWTPNYYDQWGRAIYIDESGYAYYVDAAGYPAYVGTPVDEHYGEYPPHGDPVFYDEQGRAVYLHTSGLYYTLDDSGAIRFMNR